MSLLKEIEVEAKNVKDAIAFGLEKLGLTQDDVEIKILDEGAAGLFGLMGSKPARVFLREKAKSEKSYSNVKPTLSSGIKTSLKKIDMVKLEKLASEIVDNILKLMNIKVTKISAETVDELTEIDIQSPDSALIIGYRGSSIDALEQVVNSILSKEYDTSIRVTIDTENYRHRREEKILEIAQKILRDVRKSGKKLELPPMSARERKIIHSALQKESDIITSSEGTGSKRRIVVQKK